MLRQTFAGALAGGLATVVLPSSAPVFPLASAGGLEAPGAADTLSVSLAAPAGGKVAEGASADFLVTLAGGPARSAVAVRYTVEGTADAGTDYQRLSGGGGCGRRHRGQHHARGEPSSATVEVNQTTNFTCTGTDPEGDALDWDLVGEKFSLEKYTTESGEPNTLTFNGSATVS